MNRFIIIILSVIVAVSLAGCDTLSGSEAATAKEFVEKYSAAYQSRDVNRVVGMTAVKTEDDKKGLKQEVEDDIKRQGFGYIAWTNTVYVSEKEHNGHIHVNVEVDHNPSSIVLVRENGILKISREPGSFE